MRFNNDLRLVVFVLGFAFIGVVLALVGRFRANASHPGGTLIDVSLSEAEVHSDEQAIALTIKANDFLVKMKGLCAEQRIPFIGADHFNPTSGRILQMGWEDYTSPQFELDSKDYTFKFWRASNRLSFFNNKDLEALKWGSNSTLLEKIDVPKESPQNAIQRATAFLSLLNIPIGTKLGKPYAKFEPQYELPKFRPGWWTIGWVRLDDEGHVFGCDYGASMNVPEGFGPLSIGVGLAVPYTSEKGEILSQEQALANARREIASSRKGMGISFIPRDGGIVDDKLQSADLAVVEAFPKSTWWPWSAKPKRTARLAWVFWFDPVFATPILGPTYNHRFMVSIDAHTGELIGTNAML